MIMRHPHRLARSGLFLVVALMGFFGCKRSDTAAGRGSAESAALVPAAERSAHFAAATRHLELGGLLYGYVDIDGDVERFAVALRQLATSATEQSPLVQAFVPADFAPFFVDLGLTDVKAIGFSSVAAEGGGYRNRVFLHTPQGRRGLLAGLGGAEADFAVAQFAPADADLVYETELDAPAAYAALRALVARAAGEPMANLFDMRAATPERGAPFSVRDVLEVAQGRFSLVLRVDDTRKTTISEELTVPGLDLALRLERGGAKLARYLDARQELTREERAPGVVVYREESGRSLPPLGWTPELLIEGERVTLVSRADFLVSGGGAKLADDQAFRAAVAGVGGTGNGLTYIGPRLVAKVREAVVFKPSDPKQRQALEQAMGFLPPAGVALISVRRNLPDGVLFSSHWSSSLKGDLVFANPGTMVTGGLLAAMAVPAFQKVRTTSQEKTVLNNLRQLSAASEQYFLETGKTVCTYRDLVGPDKYIRELRPVMGEDYTGMVFRQGEPVRVRLPDGRVIEHSW